MIAISANDFGRTVLCDRPGCTLDAEFGTTRCHEHTGAPDTPQWLGNPYGLEKSGRGYTWPRDAIVRCLRDYQECEGRLPTSAEWQNGGGTPYQPSTHSVIRVFGSWSAAMAAVSEREPEAEEAARGLPGAADEPTASTPAVGAARASSRSETSASDLLDDLYPDAAA